MPLYPALCSTCGIIEVYARRASTEPTIDCDGCGGTAVRQVTCGTHIGPRADRPLRLHDGTTLTSPAQLRDYQRANPNARIMAPGDSERRKIEHAAFERREQRAIKAGFSSFHAKNEHIKRTRAAKVNPNA